tara:strand:+ start:978 stop:1508 length:531 start_codon:yes stop_codon:yes gene_type:complete
MENLNNSLGEKTTSLVFYHDPYTKIKFVNEISNSYKIPLFYVDFDLLFSGYNQSQLISENPNLEILHPTEQNLLQITLELIKKTSIQKAIIIFDSLNGLYTTINEKPDSGRFIESLLMFLSYNLKFSNSKFFILSLAEKKDNEWVLSPTKRHILENENVDRLQIEEKNENLQIHVL